MNRLYKVLLLVVALFQVSCSKDFVPDVDVEPIAVLNVLVENDSAVSASVTRTWLFGGKKPDVIQDDAQVKLTVNGADMGQMEFDTESGKYKSSYIAKPGDAVSVSAHTRKYGEAIGKTIVPSVVHIDSFSCNAVRMLDPDSYYYDGTSLRNMEILQCNYKVTFTDPGDEENYYMVNSSIDGMDEPIFKEHNTALDEVFSYSDEFFVFTDKSINGKSYTLTLSSRTYHLYYGYEEDGQLIDEIRIYSISRDYYLYLLSIYRKYCGINGELEDFGMAHPKNIYSNVSPGVGIVASSTVDMIEYNKLEDIKRLFPEWLPKE